MIGILNVLVVFVFVSSALLCVVPDTVAYTGNRQCDIAKAMRRLLDNKNILFVIRALVKGGLVRPMNFGELLQDTQLSRNDLNHALLDMKNIGLIIQLSDKKYAITQYCATLLKALDEIKKDFEEKDMFAPATIEQK